VGCQLINGDSKKKHRCESSKGWVMLVVVLGEDVELLITFKVRFGWCGMAGKYLVEAVQETWKKWSASEDCFPLPN
jgi:hypothetical protein